MKRFILNTLKFFAFLSLGIGLLYFAFKGIDFTSLTSQFQEAEYGWIILSLCFAFVAYVSRAFRWNLLIEPLGYKPTLKQSYHALMVGYLANFAFPRIGEITRCGFLNRTTKIPVDSLFGTVIVERIIDMVTLLFMLLILVVARFELFGNFFSDNVILPMWQKISGTLDFSIFVWILGGSIFLLSILLIVVLKERISKIILVQKTRKALSGIVQGLKTVYRMKRRGAFLFHTLLIWLMYLLMTWVVVFAIPATSELKLIDGLFLLVVGGFGMAAPVQGGIGAYHWIVSLGLSIYGIERAEGLVFATLSHGSQSIFAILLGTISVIVIFITLRKKNNKVSLAEITADKNLSSEPHKTTVQ